VVCYLELTFFIGGLFEGRLIVFAWERVGLNLCNDPVFPCFNWTRFIYFLRLQRYQKTETAMKTTAEKTTSFLGGISTSLSAKLGAVKNSDTFRSMEERVGSVYTNVKVILSHAR